MTFFTLPCLSISPCYFVFKERQRRQMTEVAMGTKVIQLELVATKNWERLMPQVKLRVICSSFFPLCSTITCINKQLRLRGSQVVACEYLACALLLLWSLWSEWWLSPPLWVARTWYSLILSGWQQKMNLKLWWAALVIWLSLLTQPVQAQAQPVSGWW